MVGHSIGEVPLGESGYRGCIWVTHDSQEAVNLETSGKGTTLGPQGLGPLPSLR